jgi:hypothetical protein
MAQIICYGWENPPRNFVFDLIFIPNYDYLFVQYLYCNDIIYS